MDTNKNKPNVFKNSMDLVSNDRKAALEANNLKIKDSLMEVQQILKENNERDYVDPDTGHRIVNASNEKVWV